MASDLQAVDEQSLGFLGWATGRQKEAGLDAQDFGDGSTARSPMHYTSTFRRLSDRILS